MTNAEHEETISMLKKIVEASDRTNHAVRGLVRPVLIQLVTSLLTPSDRSRLGLVEVKARTKLDELMERKHGKDWNR
jgi:hypothetical protein